MAATLDVPAHLHRRVEVIALELRAEDGLDTVAHMGGAGERRGEDWVRIRMLGTWCGESVPT